MIAHVSLQGLPLLTDQQLETLPLPEYLIDGHIEKGALTVLYGPSGCGKTFIALDYALSIATGTPWLGEQVKQANVVYVVGEGTAGIAKRVLAWKKHHGIEHIDSARFTLRAVQLLNTEDVKLLVEIVKSFDFKPGLIVLDTLATCFVGGDENSAKDMGQLVSATRMIQSATEGSAVLLVHHTGKPKENGASSERGSSALRGAADAMIRVRSSKAGSVIIENDKRKDDELTPVVKASLQPVTVLVHGTEAASCVVVAASLAETPTGLDQKQQLAVDALGSLGGEATTSEWLKALGGSESSLHRRRRELVALGLVVPAGGNYKLTELGRGAVTTVSASVSDTPALPPLSHPEGVTVAVGGTHMELKEAA